MARQFYDSLIFYSVIFDSLDNASVYFKEEWWRDTLDFIRSATPSLNDGAYPLRNETIVARVHEGRTRPRSEAVLESHLAYVDVHVVLEGQETIEVWPTSQLNVRTPYRATEDVIFYDPPQEKGLRLHLSPGFFAVFFPQDAHMTQLAEQPSVIKKLVMKIAVELITGQV